MSVVARLGGALVGLLFLLIFCLAGGLAFVLSTQAGQNFVSRQTQSAVTRFLGSNYAADLGEQSFALRADGTLAIAWEGVTLHRTDRPEAPTKVAHIALALRLRPLLSGDLALGRLEIEGARIDLDAFAETPDGAEKPTVPQQTIATTEVEQSPPSVLSRTVDSAVGTLERQLGALRAFQFETVAFSDIEIEGVPRLRGGDADAKVDYAELRREGDGSLHFAGSFDVGLLPVSVSGEAHFEKEDGRLQQLSLRSSPIDLEDILPPAPLADEMDDRPFGSDADVGFTLGILRDRGTGELVSDMVVRSGPGVVQAGLNRTRVEEIELRLQHRSGEDRVRLLKSPVRFVGVELEAEGTIEPASRRDGAPSANRLRFRLGSHEIRSRVGLPETEKEGEPQRASVWIDGIFDPRRQRVDIASLKLVSDGGRLEGAGTFRYGSAIARTSFQAQAEQLEAATLRAFWPFNLSGGARRWVLENVGSKAQVRDARVALDLSLHRLRTAFRPDDELRPEELKIDLRVEGAEVKLPGALPAVNDADGQISTRGGVTRVLVDQARVDGHDSLSLAASGVKLWKPPQMARRELALDLDIDLFGDLNDILAVADAEPIRALRSLDLDPASVAGSGHVKARAALRVGRSVPREEQLRGWSVETELIDATVAKPIEGRRFATLTGPLRVVPGLVTGELSGTMDELPAELALRIPFGDQPSIERLVEIDLTLDDEKAAELVPALAEVVDGPIAAALTQTPKGLHARLDLTETALVLPMVAWRKGSGVEATLEVDVVQSEGGVALNDIHISGSGFSATGSAVADSDGLRSARLSQVSLNPGDAVAVSLDRTGNGFSVNVEGSQFDARPLLQELKGTAGKDGSEGGGRSIGIFASIDRLNGFDGQSISGFNLNYASDDGRIAALSISGTAGGGSVAADLSPRGDVQSIRMTAQDLGALIGFTGLYGRMEGGQSVLELTGTPATGYRGQLRLANFTLVDEPRLDSIVGSSPGGSSSSLSQAVGRDLRTSRAYFDQASVDLAYADGRLQVGNGILRGPVFGSSFEGVLHDREGRVDISGSFMPAYGINRIFGALPLVGGILGNGNEGGLLGITYRLSGDFASPTLTINPISIVAPGIFRQIFEY